MITINFDRNLFLREEWFNLVISLKSPDTALALLVRTWMLAQSYWIPEKRLIPMEIWRREKFSEELIINGFAEIRQEGVYIKGSDKYFHTPFQEESKKQKYSVLSKDILNFRKITLTPFRREVKFDSHGRCSKSYKEIASDLYADYFPYLTEESLSKRTGEVINQITLEEKNFDKCGIFTIFNRLNKAYPPTAADMPYFAKTSQMIN